MWPALIAGIAGYAMAARREFWRDPAFFFIAAAYSAFFFYKIHVVPEQWWMARRFLPIILPATMLFASAAVFGSSTPEHRRTVRRAVVAILFMGFLGWQYVVAARTVAGHVEYKGAITQVDKLASQFTPRDLVIVESRDAGSDYHTLALPLAYEYGLQVLVLESPVPDRRQFEHFLRDASPDANACSSSAAVARTCCRARSARRRSRSRQCPFPSSRPRTGRCSRKRSIRRTSVTASIGSPWVTARMVSSIDVGYFDDLNVVRFFAREITEGRSFRWTKRVSFVAVTGLGGDEREIEFVLHDGGRPAKAPPATLDVYLNETPLGRINVGSGFQSYRLAIPPEIIRAAAKGDNPAQLRLVSSVWVPRDILGASDDRELGVMVDRITIH
jgi:hypothetical protein